MGTGEPAPIEEDVPPEFFDESALVQVTEDHWKVNWRASLENLQDGHVYFVHRNSLELLMQDSAGLNFMLHIGANYPPTQVVNGRALVFENPRFFDFVDGNQAAQVPFGRLELPGRLSAVPEREVAHHHEPEVPGAGHGHAPQIFPAPPRLAGRRRRVGPGCAPPQHLPPGLPDPHLPRAVTPDDKEHSWIFYYNTTYPRSSARRFYNRFIFHAYYNWKQHRNFSGQDKRIVEALNYERPHEKFSRSDAFPLAWRRMVIEYARRAPGSDDADAAH